MVNITGTGADEEQTRKVNLEGSVTSEPAVIQVIEERIKVEKKLIETGKVKISKKVKEVEEVIVVPVLQEEVVVERVPVHRIVETAPQIRYEGDTMIIPVVREVVVVEKRIELIEELHIKKHVTQTQVPQQVILRKEEVTVERFAAENPAQQGL